MATGYGALALYTPSVIAPHLLAEFGWSRASFAMLGTISLVIALIIPFVGRVTDVLGVRRTAFIGIVSLPVTYFIYSLMTGPIWQYLLIYVVQNVLCITTTATVYSRVAVQYSQASRGLSLAIVASGPAVTGAILGPALNAFIEAEGWRATYHALTALTVVTGLLTLALLPKDAGTDGLPRPKRRAREDYPMIFRTPAFWVLVGSMLLCNLPQVLALSQLKILLLDNGVTAQGASVMLSAFAIGVLVGRFLAGLALDRFPAHLVGMIGMGLPGVGLLLIASGLDAPAVLTFAVLLVGLSFGAEGDVVAYLVARKFGVAVYSSVLGLVTMAIALSSSSGAALLALTLEATGGFETFLTICAVAVFAGSLMFLLLAGDKEEPAATSA